MKCGRQRQGGIRCGCVEAGNREQKHLTAQCQRVKEDAFLWRVIDQFNLIGFGCASGREREREGNIKYGWKVSALVRIRDLRDSNEHWI